MKKLMTIIMTIVVALSCVCTANADKWTPMSKEEQKEFYVNRLIGCVIEEAEKEKEEGEIDYYEVEYDPETNILRMYAEYVVKDGKSYYEAQEAAFKIDIERAIEAEGDMDNYRVDDDDMLYEIEYRFAVGYTRR